MVFIHQMKPEFATAHGLSNKRKKVEGADQLLHGIDKVAIHYQFDTMLNGTLYCVEDLGRQHPHGNTLASDLNVIRYCVFSCGGTFL